MLRNHSHSYPLGLSFLTVAIQTHVRSMVTGQFISIPEIKLTGRRLHDTVGSRGVMVA